MLEILFYVLTFTDSTFPSSCGPSNHSHHKQKLSIKAHLFLCVAPKPLRYSFIQQFFCVCVDLLYVLDTENPTVNKVVYYINKVSLVEFIFFGVKNK